MKFKKITLLAFALLFGQSCDVVSENNTSERPSLNFDSNANSLLDLDVDQSLHMAGRGLALASEPSVAETFETVKTFAYPENGVEIGQGWNSFGERGKHARCVNVVEVPIESSTFQSNLREIKSTYSLMKSSSVGGSVSGSYGGFSGGASASSSKSTKLKTENINLLFEFRSNVSGSMAVGLPVSGDPSQSSLEKLITQSSFSKLSPEAQTAAIESFETATYPKTEYRITFAPQARSLLKKKKWKAFHNLCGDGFVSAIHRGTELRVLATFRSKDLQKRRQFRAEASGGGFGVKASVATEQNKEMKSYNANTTFKVFQTGGIPVAAPSKFEDIRSAIAKPENFIINPAGYEVTITPYISLGEFIDELKKIETPNRLNRLSKYYIALNDLYRHVEDILIKAKSTTAETVNPADYEREVLNRYGGIPHLESLKDKIHADLALLEQSISNCIEYGETCTEPAAKELMWKEIYSIDDSAFVGDERESSTATIMVKKYRGDKPETNAFTIGNINNSFIETFGGPKEPIADEFFLQFYSYLTEVPLPKYILKVSQITSSPNSIDPSWQLKNGVYLEHLAPWRDYFCETFADFMCVNEEFLKDIVAKSEFIKDASGTYEVRVPRKVCVKSHKHWPSGRRHCQRWKTVYDRVR